MRQDHIHRTFTQDELYQRLAAAADELLAWYDKNMHIVIIDPTETKSTTPTFTTDGALAFTQLRNARLAAVTRFAKSQNAARFSKSRYTTALVRLQILKSQNNARLKSLTLARQQTLESQNSARLKSLTLARSQTLKSQNSARLKSLTLARRQTLKSQNAARFSKSRTQPPRKNGCDHQSRSCPPSDPHI